MHKNYDSFICIFLSHGWRKLVIYEERYDIGNFIKARDDDIHLERDVYGQFLGEKCSSLIGKPKIFIIQVNFEYSKLNV